MVEYCCAYNCYERRSKGSPYSFHSFPVDEKRRKEWENSIRRENFKATKHTRICSKHFEQECFDKEKFGGTWLKSDAVPTIFDFPDHLLKKTMKRNPPKRLTDPNEPTSSLVASSYEEKRKHFLRDFEKEDMESPSNARRVLELANKEHTVKSATMKKLKIEISRTKKVASLQSILLDTQNQRLGTESAKSILGSTGTAVKERSSTTKEYKEHHHSSIEPVVKIKEEPADDYPNPSTSNDTASEEFILPHKVDFCTATDTVVEPQFTLSVASLASPDEPEPPDCEQPKKKQRTNGPQSPVHNFEKISNPDSSKEYRKDPFDAFGEYIASELRCLDRVSSTVSQKAIGDVILEAKMGKFLNQTQNSKS